MRLMGGKALGGADVVGMAGSFRADQSYRAEVG
jgi:hypothetical protein